MQVTVSLQFNLDETKASPVPAFSAPYSARLIKGGASDLATIQLQAFPPGQERLLEKVESVVMPTGEYADEIMALHDKQVVVHASRETKTITRRMRALSNAQWPPFDAKSVQALIDESLPIK